MTETDILTRHETASSDGGKFNGSGVNGKLRTGGGGRPKWIVYLPIPRFSMLAFTSAVEPYRAANDISGNRLYDWTIVAPDGGAVRASNGVDIMGHRGLDEIDRPDAIIVCGGVEARRFDNRRVFAWLRKQARMGVPVGAVSDATYVLARAGLLEGYRCTLHWKFLDAFREEFPDLDLTGELFEIDRDRFTCCGGTAAIDLMLSIITADHGPGLAREVAENFIHQHIRASSDHQRMPHHLRLGTRHRRLLKVIEHMENNLEEVVSCAELAEHAALSTRQLERLFRTYLGCTPMRYYLELRLERARSLLVHTSMPVMDVALACGFVSASHFSRCYRGHFQKSPGQDRLEGV